MLQNRSYRRIGAFALALLFTTAWSLKTVHSLLTHHEHPVCEAAYDGKGVHIHDERFNGANCSLCAFVLSTPQLFALPALPAPPEKLPDSEAASFYRPPVCLNAACDSTLRRGPPVL